MTNAELAAVLKKNPISVGCGVLSLVLAGGIYYRSAELPDATAELEQKSTDAARYAANLKNAAGLKEQLDELQTAAKEIDGRLLRASQQLTNYQFFYKLQSDSGVKLTTLSQTPTSAKVTAKGTFNAVGFAVNAQGTLPQLLDFLRRLESGAHYCRVLSITCSSSSADHAALTLALNLELLGLP